MATGFSLQAEAAAHGSLWYYASLATSEPAHLVSAIGKKRVGNYGRYIRVWNSLCGEVKEQDLGLAQRPFGRRVDRCEKCLEMFSTGAQAVDKLPSPLIEYCVPNPKYL